MSFLLGFPRRLPNRDDIATFPIRLEGCREVRTAGRPRRFVGQAAPIHAASEFHHAHPEHQFATGVDVVLAHVVELAVRSDAEHRHAGGNVARAAPSRTASPMMCAATSMRPLGSMWKVRQWMPRVSTCWIGSARPWKGRSNRPQACFPRRRRLSCPRIPS